MHDYIIVNIAHYIYFVVSLMRRVVVTSAVSRLMNRFSSVVAHLISCKWIHEKSIVHS